MERPNPHPVGGWETVRSAYPLVPRAIGLVNGDVWVARANWDRVEVRDEMGALRFEHTIPKSMSEGLLDSMSFVDGHLACAISTGLAPYGLRAWDLHSGDVVIDLATGAVDGPYLLSIPPGTALLVVGDAECIAVWDVRLRRRVQTFPIADALSAAFDPGSRRLAHGDEHRVDVRRDDGTRIASWSIDGGDVETLAWCSGGQLLVGTTVLGGAKVWDAEDGSLVTTLNARGAIMAVSPCGRWLALEDAIVALDDLSERPLAASAAVFDSSTMSFALANGDRVWRVAV